MSRAETELAIPSTEASPSPPSPPSPPSAPLAPLAPESPSSGVALDPDIRSPLAGRFEQELRDRVVGQDQAVRAVSSLYEIALARLNSPSRPIGTLLLLGPTGCGKTRVAETAAEILFGSPAALIRIDCAEYQHPHEIAKLIGSPPGYLGHRETQPLLS